MEEIISASDQQIMVSSFLEIAVGQTTETARQFLQATSWRLEEAIQLFYVGSEGGTVPSVSDPRQLENEGPLSDQRLGTHRDVENENVRQDDASEVRPPLPVRREALYDNTMSYGGSRMGYPLHDGRPVVPFRNFEDEMKHPGIWQSDQGATSTPDTSRDNLASLYRPPFALMYHGPFEKAKDAARVQDKWLFVNLQSTREFSSHMLNRDTWANEAVAQTISNNFIFWQIYDDTEEGSKVSTYYKLDSAPVTLVIDPVTGQKMRMWDGMIQPENLLEDLLPFMDNSPKDHHISISNKRPRESPQTTHKTQNALVSSGATNEEDEELQLALAASMESMKDTGGVSSKDRNITDAEKDKLIKKPIFPPLPEEPKGNKSLLCRVGVRLPNGHRVQRNFFRTDPIQLLWSFCYSQLEEAETRPFRLAQAIPGATKCLDYDSNSTFEESGLANSMISVTWE